MERLVVWEAIQVLIVLLIHLEVVLPVTITFEVVKQADQDLERDKTIGTSLMLRAYSDDVELLRNFFETPEEVKTVHERLYIEHVGDVVL